VASPPPPVPVPSPPLPSPSGGRRADKYVGQAFNYQLGQVRGRRTRSQLASHNGVAVWQLG
jgi:hypothetical protein